MSRSSRSRTISTASSVNVRRHALASPLTMFPSAKPSACVMKYTPSQRFVCPFGATSCTSSEDIGTKTASPTPVRQRARTSDGVLAANPVQTSAPAQTRRPQHMSTPCGQMRASCAITTLATAKPNTKAPPTNPTSCLESESSATHPVVDDVSHVSSINVTRAANAPRSKKIRTETARTHTYTSTPRHDTRAGASVVDDSSASSSSRAPPSMKVCV